MTRMRLAPLLSIIALCAIVSGCGSTTTSTGSLGGPVDLRQHLPVDVAERSPSDAQAQHYQTELPVGKPPATVRLRWNVFEDGPDAYLLSYSVEVLESSPGVEIAAGGGHPINGGSTDAVVEAVPVTISWFRRSFLSSQGGSVVIEIAADGTWQ